MIDFPQPPAGAQQVLESLHPALPRGIASWYSESDPGINPHTANGEIFNDEDLTCASWDYPFNTRLAVTNLQNGRTVLVRVNDRGPAKRLNRLIDLTQKAFSTIADLKEGLIEVEVSPAVETQPYLVKSKNL